MQSDHVSTGALRLVALAFAISVGLQMSAANAQAIATARPNARLLEPTVASPSVTTSRAIPNQGGKYYIEFRSRYAAAYGHSFVVFGRGAGPGKKITPDQIAGLHPATNSPIPWYVGHIVPVTSETGASEGDTDEIYVSARYRVPLNKAEYDRVVGYIRQLQATKTLWSAEFYNCNDFVADIARFVGLKVPSTMLFPQHFINGIRDLNSAPGRTAALPAAAPPRQ
jgi:hypothetical protein